MTHWISSIKDAESPELAGFKESVEQFGNGEFESGSRNEHLNKLAFRGGCLVAEEKASEYWVTEELTAAAEKNGYAADYGDSEVERIIRAGFQAAEEQCEKPAHENPLYDIVLTARQLGTIPPADWMVDDLLLENSLAILAGDGGVGKSFMAIDLAASLAKLKSWHGRKISRPAKTVYVAGEGISGLNNRRMAWEKIHKAVIGDDLHIFPRAIQAGTKDWDNLVEYVEDIRPGLTVIDTLSKTSNNFEENTPSDMAKYLGECDRLRIASGGTVLVIHHTSKDGGYRGSTPIKDNVDTLMYLFKDKSDALSLYIGKHKDGVEGDFGEYRLKTVEVGRREDGKAINSAVFMDHGHVVPWGDNDDA